MNTRSGGGKVVTFGLQQEAEELGAEVALPDGPGYVDVGVLVRAAADRGAGVLGVAGGDGTHALVASIAAERDIALLVISAGTAITSRSTSAWTGRTRPPACGP